MLKQKKGLSGLRPAIESPVHNEAAAAALVLSVRACLPMTTPASVGRKSIAKCKDKLLGRRQPSKPEVVDRTRPIVEMSHEIVSRKGPLKIWAVLLVALLPKQPPSQTKQIKVYTLGYTSEPALPLREVLQIQGRPHCGHSPSR